MSIYYDLYQSPGQDDESDIPMHARATSLNTLTTTELLDRMVQGSRTPKSQARFLLDRMVEELKIAIAQGYRVHVDGLGYFAPQLTTSQPADRRTKHPVVRATGLHFSPEKDVKKYLMSINTIHTVSTNHTGRRIDEADIDEALRQHFATEQTVTRKQFQASYPGISRTSLCTYLRRCVEQDKLRNVGTKNAPVYVKGEKL